MEGGVGEVEATRPWQQLQQPGENQTWRVRAGAVYTTGEGRWREGGEEDPGLSPDLSSNLETNEVVEIVERIMADPQYLTRPVWQYCLYVFLLLLF